MIDGVEVSEDVYEVFGLRYGSRGGRKAHEYLGYARYGEPDVEYPMSYYVWVARSATRVVLVDCGYNLERSERKGRYQENDRSVEPVEMLRELGIEREDVDHVVLSHMHFDHVGNVHAFPNATFSIGKAEFDFWSGPMADRSLLSSTMDPEEMASVIAVRDEGRLIQIDGEGSPVPGIEVIQVGGHTPGQVITQVVTPGGVVVLASDALHFYEEMELDRPFWFFFNLQETFQVYERLLHLDSRDDVHVVPGHDPLIMERHPSVADNVVDVTVRA